MKVMAEKVEANESVKKLSIDFGTEYCHLKNKNRLKSDSREVEYYIWTDKCKDRIFESNIMKCIVLFLFLKMKKIRRATKMAENIILKTSRKIAAKSLLTLLIT